MRETQGFSRNLISLPTLAEIAMLFIINIELIKLTFMCIFLNAKFCFLFFWIAVFQDFTHYAINAINDLSSVNF